MAVVNSTTKGLMSASMFNKLNALPSKSQLDTSLGNKADNFTLSDELELRSAVLGFSDETRTNIASFHGSAIWLYEDEDTHIDATADNQDRIKWRWWEREAYENIPVHYTDPVLQKRDLANTDLPNGYNWGGVHTTNPGGINNNIWFDRDPNARGWRRNITSPISTTLFWTPNFTFLGIF